MVQVINRVIKLNHLRRAELSQKPLEEVGLPLGLEGGQEWEGAEIENGLQGRAIKMMSRWIYDYEERPRESGLEIDERRMRKLNILLQGYERL